VSNRCKPARDIRPAGLISTTAGLALVKADPMRYKSNSHSGIGDHEHVEIAAKRRPRGQFLHICEPVRRPWRRPPLIAAR
jgi:hypothetical protein